MALRQAILKGKLPKKNNLNQLVILQEFVCTIRFLEMVSTNNAGLFTKSVTNCQSLNQSIDRWVDNWAGGSTDGIRLLINHKSILHSTKSLTRWLINLLIAAVSNVVFQYNLITLPSSCASSARDLVHFSDVIKTNDFSIS